MLPLRRFAVIAVPACCIAIAGATSAADQAACPVRGVWEMIAVSNNGKDQPMHGAKQWKFVTQSRYVWVEMDAKRDTIPLKTAADTLRHFFMAGGAGTYSLSGNAYVENLDLFSDPAMVGKTWKATCHMAGNLWHHSFVVPQDTTGVARDSIAHVVETWRRVE